MNERRLLTLEEAAAYVGLSANTFMQEVRAGTFPGPFPLTETRRRLWDVRALDAAIDRAAPAQDAEAVERIYHNIALAYTRETGGADLGRRVGEAMALAALSALTPDERPDAVRSTLSDSVRAVAARRFACMARTQSGANDPQDCEYPHCGCGPENGYTDLKTDNSTPDVERATVERLREALRPFKDAFERCHNTPDTSTDDWHLNHHTGLTYGDLRRAASALAADEKERRG